MSEVRKGKKMPPFSEEHKSNLSKSLKGRNPSHSTKIICLETGIIYNSITEAAKKLNLDKSNISKVIRGKAKTSGKLTFKVGE
jgi:DNA-binding MarR family transcriptional regulator